MARSTSSSQPAPVVVVRSAKDIVAARKARIAALQGNINAATDQETIEALLVLMQDESDLQSALNELDKTRRSANTGSVNMELAAAQIRQLDSDLKQVKTDLRHYGTTVPAAFEVATRRMNVRRNALEYAETVSANDPAGIKAENIRTLVASAVESGFIRTTSSEGTFSWDHQAYESADPADECVSSVAGSLAELIDSFGQVRKDRNDSIREEVRRHGFLLSWKREKSTQGEDLPSEIDLIREDSGYNRNLTSFLQGHGQKTLVSLGERQGEVLLERVNEKIHATKTSNAFFGYSLFFFKRDGQKMAKDRPVVVEANGTDVSKVWHDGLREAMGNQIAREAESQERRDAASELRDVSKLDSPLTFADLRSGKKGVCPVSTRWTIAGREVPVNFQLVGSGDGNFVLGDAVNGVIEKMDPDTRWLAQCKEPQPLDLLDRSKAFKALAALNRYFERDWQVQLETKRRNAVEVSGENLQNLIGIDGKDGMYAVRVTLRKKVGQNADGNKYVYNPVGFLIERTGTKVQIVWSLSGTSANYAASLKDAYEITDLPNNFRQIFGNLDYAVTKTNNQAHLQFVKNGSGNTDEE